MMRSPDFSSFHVPAPGLLLLLLPSHAEDKQELSEIVFVGPYLHPPAVWELPLVLHFSIPQL